MTTILTSIYLLLVGFAFGSFYSQEGKAERPWKFNVAGLIATAIIGWIGTVGVLLLAEHANRKIRTIINTEEFDLGAMWQFKWATWIGSKLDNIVKFIAFKILRVPNHNGMIIRKGSR